MQHVICDLVDELGILRETISRLSDREQQIKDMLIMSRNPEIRGLQFKVTITCSMRSYLNTEKVRSILSEEQISACTMSTESITLRTKRI